MGSEEKCPRSSNLHRHLHLHLHHHHHNEGKKQVPKGCMPIKVGKEEQQRFVIPVVYVNHPLFIQLLKKAEEEYGFDHKGIITIPCRVEEFRNIQGLIGREISHHHVCCFGF